VGASPKIKSTKGNTDYTLFEKSIFIHPTLAEGFFTLMDNVKPV
jgi:hypothetical protein